MLKHGHNTSVVYDTDNKLFRRIPSYVALHAGYLGYIKDFNITKSFYISVISSDKLINDVLPQDNKLLAKFKKNYQPKYYYASRGESYHWVKDSMSIEEFLTEYRYYCSYNFSTPSFLTHKFNYDRNRDVLEIIISCKSDTTVNTLNGFSPLVKKDVNKLIWLLCQRYKLQSGYLEISRMTLTLQKEFVVIVDVKKEIRDIIKDINKQDTSYD